MARWTVTDREFWKCSRLHAWISMTASCLFLMLRLLKGPKITVGPIFIFSLFQRFLQIVVWWCYVLQMMRYFMLRSIILKHSFLRICEPQFILTLRCFFIINLNMLLTCYQLFLSSITYFSSHNFFFMFCCPYIQNELVLFLKWYYFRCFDLIVCFVLFF